MDDLVAGWSEGEEGEEGWREGGCTELLLRALDSSQHYLKSSTRLKQLVLTYSHRPAALEFDRRPPSPFHPVVGALNPSSALHSLIRRTHP